MGFYCSVDGNEGAGFTVEDRAVPEIGDLVEYEEMRYLVRAVSPRGRRTATRATQVEVHLTPVKGD